MTYPLLPHSSLGSFIQLRWVWRSRPHSLWPRLTNISHCYHTVLRWQAGGMPLTKQGKQGAWTVGLSWADLSLLHLLCNSEPTWENQKKHLRTHSDTEAGSVPGPPSWILSSDPILHKQSLFLETWETKVKQLITQILKLWTLLFVFVSSQGKNLSFQTQT